MLIITKSIKGDKAVFALEGRLDTITAPELEKALEELPDGVKELTLDMAGLEYISSAGLRVLLETHMNMKLNDGKMKLIHVGEMVASIFQATSFSDIFAIE